VEKFLDRLASWVLVVGIFSIAASFISALLYATYLDPLIGGACIFILAVVWALSRVVRRDLPPPWEI
jgi:hypothetical protein